MNATTLEVGIVADDLTSAADGAGPFVAVGRAAMVGRAGHVPTSGDVRAVDTGSRAMPAAAAAVACADATVALAHAPILFKTVDSTLRGHVAAEIAAAALASGRRCVVFAPAFPAAGRTTEAGLQRVAGVQLMATEYAHDPVHPASTACLADLVSNELGAPPVVAAASPGALASAVRGHKVVLVDVVSQSALDAAVAEVAEPEAVLWVGSPGMARALAGRLTPRRARPAESARAGSARVLVVIGTRNSTSRAQLVELTAAGACVLDLSDPNVARGRHTPAVLTLVTPAALVPDPQALSLALAARAEALIAMHAIDSVVVTGGHTLDVILARLGVRELALGRELEPGFAQARVALAAGPPVRTLTVATKAGGFGDPLTLVRAVARLGGRVG